MEPRRSTKELLRESGIELISKKRVEKVSVKDIAEHAGVSIRSFYNFFEDKMDFVLWIYTDNLDKFLEAHANTVTLREFCFHTGHAMFEPLEFYLNVVDYLGQNNFRAAVYAPLVERYLWIIQNRYHDPVTPDITNATRFFVGGMVDYIYRCMVARKIPTVPEAVAIFDLCVPDCLKKYY